MPPLIAIIYYFRCSSNKEPKAEEEILVLVTAQKQSGLPPLLNRASNQNMTCEKERTHPEGQAKVAAMTSQAQGCDLLMVWRQGAGQGHLEPRMRLLRTD